MASKKGINEGKRAMPRLFSYVVEHDSGHAPNPYFGVCTLCRCKFRKSSRKPKNLVEKAQRGDWVVGTGGANKRKSAGHGKIVYAMRVDDKMTRLEYYRKPEFEEKKNRRNGNYEQQMGDNTRPITRFEEKCQFVLVSCHFYYFGRNAIPIPKKRFPHLEKSGPGFRSDFKDAYLSRFRKWLETEIENKPGRCGDPCMKEREVSARRKGCQVCKSSC